MRGRKCAPPPPCTHRKDERVGLADVREAHLLDLRLDVRGLVANGDLAGRRRPRASSRIRGQFLLGPPDTIPQAGPHPSDPGQVHDHEVWYARAVDAQADGVLDDALVLAGCAPRAREGTTIARSVLHA